MKIYPHVELSSYSTFMLSAQARFFVSIKHEDDISSLVTTKQWQDYPHYFLGGGSNTAFIDNYQGIIVKNEIEGLSIESEDEEYMVIKVGAGEDWNNLVMWSLDQSLWGFENLVLIPGSVGAAPVQNIGAYGVEIADTIISVDTYDTHKKEKVRFTNSECNFKYRTSIFKEHPGRYFITHVRFRLMKKAQPVLEYGAVRESIAKRYGDDQLTPAMIAEVIVGIRDEKLPRVSELGTAGSFFKNPVITKEEATMLQKKYPGIPCFNYMDNIKVSAAWLIDYCGLKGVRKGAIGTYEKHALVLVNYGGAQGSELWDFATMIIDNVYQEFSIILEPEVNIIGNK
jgi:UDP-N-acetylmuramate dehydrogenase